MSEARRLGAQGIAGLLPEGAPVYVSIGVDALDMSLVPGCVSGEPDGLGCLELMGALRAVAERCEITGSDFVEVNPQLDVGTGATAYLGAGHHLRLSRAHLRAAVVGVLPARARASVSGQRG